jgi:hypothetical protein
MSLIGMSARSAVKPFRTAPLHHELFPVWTRRRRREMKTMTALRHRLSASFSREFRCLSPARPLLIRMGPRSLADGIVCATSRISRVARSRKKRIMIEAIDTILLTVAGRKTSRRSIGSTAPIIFG